jgi:hypothetical protein
LQNIIKVSSFGFHGKQYFSFQKIKSDITNNISEVDKQKRNFLSDISDIRKSVNDHLDQIEKQTVEEMVSVEQNLQVELKKVLFIFCYLKNGT